MRNVELLAPAGNLEKLKFAVKYGADAIYLGGKQFGLRAFAGNFSIEEMEEGVSFAHNHNVKVYVTINIFPHNDDLVQLPAYLKDLERINVDGIICADPGVFAIAKETTKLPIHISTQANTVNWSGVKFWKDLGAERVVLARELSLDEISEIKEKIDVELEAFVHGAMCISYSGRCLLSNYMTDRDSNKGECAQACRWNYNLVEEKRPNEFYPVMEDERGTYVFNSQDLCLFNHLEKIIDAGIDSLKLEGRMKSAYYVATILRAYRKAIDAYLTNDTNFDRSYWEKELEKISHRPYTTGFYFGKPEDGALTLENPGYIQDYEFIGVVLDYNEATGEALIEQRNWFAVGENLEFFSPNYDQHNHTITSMIDHNGDSIEYAPHPRQQIRVNLPFKVYPYDLIRKVKTANKKARQN